MKILLSAYACHPGLGSEPGVGWNWVRGLAEYHELWVLIYSGQGQKEAVQRGLSTLQGAQNIHLIPIDVPRMFERGSLYRLRYEIWQKRAYRVAKDLVKSNNIDLIHHVTIAAWWNCGYLWKLPIPFVFGPISGGQRVPHELYGFLRLKERAYERTREALVHLLWTAWPRARQALKKSKIVLAANEETLRKAQSLAPHTHYELFTEVGAVAATEEGPAKVPPSRELRIVSVGQLIPTKNLGLLLEAVSGLPKDCPWRLRVIGGGPLHSYWRAQVEARGLADRISFLGNVDHGNISEQYGWANVFAFPSLREATGTVILEAMSCAVPIVALAIHGAKVVLDDSMAILVHVGNQKEVVRRFREALESLWKDPSLGARLAAAAQRHARGVLTWQARIEKMNTLYAQWVRPNAPPADCEEPELLGSGYSRLKDR